MHQESMAQASSSTLPHTHHRRTSEMVKSKRSLIEQQSKVYLDHKKAELDKKREQQVPL